jgi:Ca-activated chloride channel family protein
MKKNIVILNIVFSALLATAATPETTQELIVGLSPFQSVGERTNQVQMLQQFFPKDAPDNSHIVVWDAWELRVVCDVTLPKFAYDSPAARAPHMVAGLTNLKQWFTKMDGTPIPTGLKGTGAIKIPEWLQAATAQAAAGRRTIIILASPLCLVPSEPSFSMIETRYPSDAHLTAGEKSIYSIIQKRGLLANTVVLWAYPSENVWASQFHKDLVARFWSLFISGQGPNAELAFFSSDAAQALSATKNTQHRAIGEYAVNAGDSALVMHTAAPREVPVKIQPHPVQVSRPEPTPAPAPAPVLAKPEPPTAPTPAVLMTPMPVASKPKLIEKEVVKLEPVILDVTVVDRGNRPVVDLDKSDFSIFENGVQQEPHLFTRDRQPVSLLVLIDTSGSISSKLSKIREVAASIIRQGQPQDEFCIVRFTRDASVVQGFTTNVLSLEQALNSLKAGGDTALLDAVKFAVQYANDKGRHDRKGVVVVTDGGEADSRCSRSEVMAALRVANTRLYSIAFPDGLNQSKTRGPNTVKPLAAESSARDLMDDLAGASGGRAFYPRQVTELDGIAESIGLELRTQYRLGYIPSHADRDGQWREVKVKVAANQGHDEMVARTKAGYFAPQAP